MSNTYVITDEQINSIINTLDRMAKAEGISLQGSANLIEGIIKPLTSLQPITVNPPVEPEIKENAE